MYARAYPTQLLELKEVEVNDIEGKAQASFKKKVHQSYSWGLSCPCSFVSDTFRVK